MRGDDRDQTFMFSYVSPEDRLSADHPLRRVRLMTDQALRELSGDFAKLCSPLGRPSIAPEKLLRGLLLQAFFSVRSERLLMEQLHYNLLFRWFVGLSMDEPVWDATVFSKNRDRLLNGRIAQAFLGKVLEQARVAGLLSSEHFTVDGTLLEAWASMKSYQKKEHPPEKGSGRRGRRLRRDDYASKTDPEAQLYRKSKSDAFRMSYLGHVLMENRSGLPVGARVTDARPQGEWEAALDMAAACQRRKQITMSGGQSLRRRRICAESARAGDHPTRAKERSRAAPQQFGWPNYASPGIFHQPAKAQADRAHLRLAEDDSFDAQSPPSRPCSRGVDVHASSERLQSRADEPTGSSAGITQGRSVPWRVENGLLRRVPPTRQVKNCRPFPL